MPLPKQKKNNGYTMLVTAIIFTLVSVVIVLGLTTPIVKQILLSDDIWGAKQSYYLSEAGAEDVLYRLKSATFNQYVGTSEPITLAGYSATTTLSGSLGGVNGITLTTLSNKSGYDKKIQTTVKQGSGVSFTYGVQVGTGGISLNSSKIVGNVYSAGNIVMTNPTSAITGSAIVSDSPSMTADQENDTPTSSPDTISFTNAAATQDVAQSFQVSSTSVLTQASLYLKEVGSPSSNITVDIVKDKNGSPSTSASDIVSSATISSSLITSNFDWVDVALSPNPSLIVGNTYWLVLNGSTNSSSNYYVIGANLDTSYASGTAKTGQLGSTWNNTGYDAYFRIYLGGFFGSISGEGQYNTLSVGSVSTDMAWAHSISYVNVTGPLRCQNDTLNSKACDQTYPDPSPVSYPVSSGNITAWETAATAGGVESGDYTLPSGAATLGPEEINGNLHVTGGGVLTVSGTLYVTGNVTLDGGATIKLASSYGSNGGIIVTNGTVTITGGSSATGDGQSGSYIMFVTTSNCAGGSTCSGNYAASISGGSGAIVVNAQSGTISLSGGVSVNEATANQLILSGNSTVTYQSGLANPNFSTGPSGGFNITSWKELNN